MASTIDQVLETHRQTGRIFDRLIMFSSDVDVYFWPGVILIGAGLGIDMKYQDFTPVCHVIKALSCAGKIMIDHCHHLALQQILPLRGAYGNRLIEAIVFEFVR